MCPSSFRLSLAVEYRLYTGNFLFIKILFIKEGLVVRQSLPSMKVDSARFEIQRFLTEICGIEIGFWHFTEFTSLAVRLVKLSEFDVFDCQNLRNQIFCNNFSDFAK